MLPKQQTNKQTQAMLTTWPQNNLLSEPGFLNLRATDIFRWVFPCSGGPPAQCRMFGSLPRLYPLDASNIPDPQVVITKKVSRYLSLAENHCYKVNQPSLASCLELCPRYQSCQDILTPFKYIYIFLWTKAPKTRIIISMRVIIHGCLLVPGTK